MTPTPAREPDDFRRHNQEGRHLMASEASMIVEITGDKAKVLDALNPTTIGMNTLAELAQHAADEKVRLDAALALLGRL